MHISTIATSSSRLLLELQWLQGLWRTSSRIQFHQDLHQVQAVGLQKHQMTHLSVWGLHQPQLGFFNIYRGFKTISRVFSIISWVFNIFSKVASSMTSRPCWHQWQFHQQSPPFFIDDNNSCSPYEHAPLLYSSLPLWHQWKRETTYFHLKSLIIDHCSPCGYARS